MSSGIAAPILVTGASGFLGRNLLEQLAAAGHGSVYAAARNRGPDLPGVAWHAVDLLEAGAMPRLIDMVRPRTVLHLAWCATPGVFWTSPENEQWRAATLALAQACAGLGTRLVAAGSVAEYDWTGAGGTIVENVTPYAPATPYGAAKHATRLALEDMRTRTGLSYAWLRVFWTCGRHEHPDRLVPAVIRGLLERRDVPLTEGMQALDMVAASDLARAFLAAAGSDAIGAFDLASGVPVAVREICERLAAQVGGREHLKLGARPTPAGTPPLVVGRASRLEAATGWRPQLTLDEMLGEAIAFWRAKA